MRHFNSYLETEDPFHFYHNFSEIGYSWMQSEDLELAVASITKLARKLHASAPSEASCERVISKQRLIYYARMKHTNRELLDARLTIMNATYDPMEKEKYLVEKSRRLEEKLKEWKMEDKDKE